MKNAFLFLISLFTFQTLTIAQEYTLTVSNQSYTDLDDPISVNNGLTWDEPEFIVPIGFDFNFFDESIDSLFFLDDSALLNELGNDEIVAFAIGNLGMTDRGFDLNEGEPGSLSPISYQLSGSPGSRIFKLEWKNAGFFRDGEMNDGVYSDFTNIQFWLYESDGAIEIRYGESDRTNLEMIYESLNYAFTSVCFLGVFDDDFEPISDQAYILDGTATDPTLDLFSTGYYYGSLEANTPYGTVYRIARMTSADNEPNNDNAKIIISPNPTTGLLQVNTNIIDNEIESIKILDINGRCLKSYNSLNNIDISDLPAMCYFLNIQTADEVWNERIIKLN